MLEIALPFIISHVVPFGAIGILVACFIDEAIPVVPASIILLAAGFFFLHGPFSWMLMERLMVTIAMPAAIGLTLGSLVIYSIAYWGGRPVIMRFGKWVGISWDDVEKLNMRLAQTNWDEDIIFIAWVLPIIPSGLLSLFGGVTRIRPLKYTGLTLAGTFFKAIGMGIIGWKADQLYFTYASTIDRFENVLAVIVVLAVIGFIWYRKKVQKQLQKNRPDVIKGSI